MTSRPEAGRVSVEAMPERPLPAPAPTDLLPLPLLAWDTCEAQVMLQSHPAPSSDPVSFPKATNNCPSPPAALSQYRQEQAGSV